MDNEDIGIHGLEFGNNYKKTGHISLLNILIHLWLGNWRENMGRM